MAPISEKRSSHQQQPQVEVVPVTSTMHNHHHHHNNHHSKENASGRNNDTVFMNAKGLEIRDFHETWLEGMEVYKDIMQPKKHVPHQLLGSHNHAHTPQGCQIDMVNNQQHSSAKMQSNLFPNAGAPAGRSTASGGGGMKRVTNDKARVRMTNPEVVIKDGIRNGDNVSQLHLKRPREETPLKAAATAGVGVDSSSFSSHLNAKRSGYNSSHATTNSQNANTNSHSTNYTNVEPNATTNGTNSTSSASASSSEPSSPKNNTRIVVNQFHASSLLNGQLEDKEKVLTQNGLNSTSSTAHEASFYANNYLNSETHNNESHRIISGDSNNSAGVSLDDDAYNQNDEPDDDPCADIDDVNNYSDSDTDEEYTGDPFFLRTDDNGTLQSKNIRNQSLDTTEQCEKSGESSTKNSVYYTPKTILSPSLFPNVPPYLNYSSHATAGPSMPAQLHKVLKWKLSPVMPKIVKRVVLNSGFRIIKNTTDWMAVWEKHMKSPGFRTIRSHQKYNHMPGSFRIGRKDSMWRSIYQNVKKFGRKEFGFMQKSYVMPDDLENLRKAWPKNAARLTKWILKPPASARGTGISIVNRWSQFPKDRPLVVQKYIERPLLINDSKFDMRIYVVVTSINPLRIYLYKDGLARFASVKYSSELNSLDERCMHLTNYSINKFSENYSKNEDVNACQGHKWTLQSLWSCLEERGVNTKRLWATLRNLVIKALVSGESGLNRMYRQNVNFRYNCFELFGFDVLLDENLIPWLLEINISPSLHSELPLDLHVKGPLIQAVLNTALYQVPPKLTEKQQNEILDELKLNGPLCHEKRLFTTCLRAEEIRKHNQFTNRSIELREEYLDAILENLQPDDVRCLVISEDELNRCSPLERIFPTPDTYSYLKYVENPRYYNRLLDAWEHRYGHCRQQGVELLRGYCKDSYHLIVSDAALEKEPNGKLTEIDVLHVKKDDANIDNPDAAKTSTPANVCDNSATQSEPSNLRKTAISTKTNTSIASVAATNEIRSTQIARLQNANVNKESSFTSTTNKSKFQENADRKPKTDIKSSY